VEADMVGCGLGLNMYVGFLKDTPLQIRAGIVTNEFLETNVPDVYAAGDVAEFYDVSIGQYHRLGTWANAIAHGRRAALNMLGRREQFVDVPIYTSTLFESKMSVMGMTTEEADYAGNSAALQSPAAHLPPALLSRRSPGRRRLHR